MSIRTNPMKAVPVLLKRVKATRTKFLRSGWDESLDGKMQMLTRELTKIKDVFMKVKRNQDELVDTLHEVDWHLRKLDRKRLDQDMDDFCKRIRDCAHKLLPMDDFDEDQNTQTVQSSDHPSSSQHDNNQLLLPHKLLPMEAFESNSSDEKSGKIVKSSSHVPSSTQHNNNHLLLPQPQNVSASPQFAIQITTFSPSTMSIRTNPMKAIPVLLKRVKATRTKFHQRGTDYSFDSKMEMLMRELTKIKDVFERVKRNQDQLLDALHEVDVHLRKLDRKRLDQDMVRFCKRIRACARKLHPVQSSDDPSSSQPGWDKLSSRERFCLLSLSHFPKDAVIKKRLAIYLWNGWGIIGRKEEKSGEEEGVEVIDELFKLDLIVPYANAKSPIVNKFQIHPLIHPLIHHNNNQLLPQPFDLTWDELRFHQQLCLKSLSIFPKYAVLNKRQAIYLWIGWGSIQRTQEKTAEEVGEEVIDELLKLNLIVPYGNAKSPIVNKFQIHPLIHGQLAAVFYVTAWSAWLVLRQRNVTIHLDSETAHYSRVINASSSYLNFGSQWLDKTCSLEVLQLGSWQDSPLPHIEVANQDFLNDLRHQRKLRHLSLRRISRVLELPPSITNVESLQILDLKACHNLETLPDDISSLKNLTHLILSQCYLLDSMPKGIDKLYKLQVLKGFVLGNSRKTPCRISDLAQLKHLRRLSILIAREAVIEYGEFESLEELSKLQHLKISWGMFDPRYSEMQINLPPSLKKLHLQGFPGQKIPEWLKPSKVPRGLKELSLTGGKLESMNHNQDTNQWGMEIVRLKHLMHLEIDITHLQMLFPSLKYALIKTIPYRSYTEWSID